MSNDGVASGALDAVVCAATAQWPTFKLSPSEFRQRVVAVLPADAEDAARALANLHAADLYLAHACALGIPEAIDAFTARYLVDLARYLPFHKDVSVEWVRNELEDKLLLGKGDSNEPRIGRYEGRGPLHAFVRRAARFSAATFRRQAADRREVAWVEEFASVLCSSVEGSKRVVISRYAEAIRRAVLAALRTLERRQRTVVRLHLAEGVPLTKIAKMFGVNQSTASRWLQAAIEHLYAEIRRTIREVHGVTDSELKSIWRDVRSEVDLSLSRALVDTSSPVT